MDPLHPLPPLAPTPGPIAPAPSLRRTERDRDPGGGAYGRRPPRRHAEPAADGAEPPGDGDERPGDDGGPRPHVDVIA